MIFDLTGASVALAATGGEMRDIITPLVIALLVVVGPSSRQPQGEAGLSSS